MTTSPSHQRSESVVDARLNGASGLWYLTAIGPHHVRPLLLDPHAHWRQITLPGGRVVFKPSKDMVRVQRAFHHLVATDLLADSRDHCAQVQTAFDPGCSHIRNARFHAHQSSSLMLDLTNAFGSIKRKHVERYLRRHDVHPDWAWIFSRVWTHDGHLRQGAPCAPHIFNMLLHGLDDHLVESLGAPMTLSSIGKDERPRVIYSRYADNLCFSSAEVVFPDDIEAVIREIIERHCFVLNEDKTVRGSHGHLVLPGIDVHGGVVQPNHRYVRRALRVLAQTRKLQVVRGHWAYLRQFGTEGIPPKLQRRLELASSRSLWQH